MRIEFLIDELVLVGFDPRDRLRLADAIERQLAARARASDVMPLVSERTDVPMLRVTGALPTSGAAGTSREAIAAGVTGSIVSALAGQGKLRGGTP